MNRIKEADITIIGAGIAGCIAALALSKHFNVVLIDKKEQCGEKVGECLAPAASRILHKLNLLESLLQDNENNELLLPFHGVRSYWGSHIPAHNDNLRNPDGLGWQLNRAGFEHWLRKQVARSGVTCLWPATILDVQQGHDGWLLSIDHESIQYLPSHFVIDASGRQSKFASMLSIKRHALDKHVSYWATADCYQTQQLATISSCDYGWWYSAKLPNNKRVFSLQTEPQLVSKGLQNNKAEYYQLAAEQPAMRTLLPDMKILQLQGMVSANSARLQQASGRVWAAIGDTAFSLDPLSSLGMFNGMATAMQLSDLLIGSDLNSEITQSKIGMEYQHQIDTIWDHYLKHRGLFYGMEQRFKHSKFWQHLNLTERVDI